MDFSLLTNSQLDEFFSYIGVDIPQSRKNKIERANYLFQQLITNRKSSYTAPVVDLYISSLPSTQELPNLSMTEVMNNSNELMQKLEINDLDRLIRILTLANKIDSLSVKEIKMSDVLPFSNKTYFLSSLICGQFHYPHQFLKVFQDNPCTIIGSKISTSLIKVAAKRIFSDPYQSILEPIVNSLDAYSINKVGKFGLGFYSILYWLIDHPTRSLTLDSHSKDGHWLVKIYEKSNQLVYDFIVLEPTQDVYGLKLVLDYLEDPIQPVKFYNQLDKLTEATGAQIWVNKTKINKTDISNQIEIILNKKMLSVQDWATGVTLSVLFGSLLVPSVSDKKISTSLAYSSTGKGELTRIEKSDENFLTILVGTIGVVMIPYECPVSEKYHLILDLSLAVRIPTSRDDIIIQDKIKKELTDNLDFILDSCLNLKTIVPLECAIQAYLNFTASETNKKFFQDYLLSLEKINYIKVPYEYSWLYRQINNNYIEATNYSVEQLENNLFDTLEFNYNIFWGKGVVIIDFKENSELTTNGGTAKILFVDQDYVNQNSNWIYDLPLVELKDTLLPVTLDYSSDISTEIIEAVSYVKTFFSDKLLSLLTNFLLRYRRLDVYFKMDTTYFDRVIILNCYYLNLLYGEEIVVKYLLEWFKLFPKMQPINVYGGSKFTLKSYPMVLLLEHRPLGLSYIYKYENKLRSYQEYYETAENFLRQNFYIHSKPIQEKIKKYALDYLFWVMNKSISVDKWLFHTILDYDNPLYMAAPGIKKRNGVFHDKMEEVIQYTNNFKEFLIMMEIENPLHAHRYIRDYHANEEFEQSLSNHVKRLIKIIRTEYTDFVLEEMIIYTYIKHFSISFLNVIAKRVFDQIRLLVEYNLAEVSIPEYPQDNFIRTTLSSILTFSFQEQVDPKEFLDQLISTKVALPNLQLIEVAINENTTNPFWDAVMIELTQNTLDALRSSNEEKVLDIKLNMDQDAEGDWFILYSMSDPVGIPKEAYVALTLPFVSTKGSLQTTGEIGSGFFNVYRESQVVYIESCKDGYEVLIIDIPIRDQNGRTIDLDKTVVVNPNSNKRNGTTITLVVPTFTKNQEEALETIGNVIYKIKTILAPIPPEEINIKLNGEPIGIETVSVSNSDLAEARMISEIPFVSYILTKSVPFRPLVDYFSELLPKEVIKELENNLLINIKTGYSPVSSRTTLNINMEEKFNRWLTEAIYIFLLQNYVKSKRDHYIPQTNSQIFNQLYFADDLENIQSLGDWILYTKTENYPRHLAFHFNNMITFLNKVEYTTKLPGEVLYYVNQYFEQVALPELQQKVIKLWFENKSPEKSLAEIEARIQKEKQEIPEILNNFSQIFVDAFWLNGFELEKEEKLVGSKFLNNPNPPKTSWNYLSASFYRSRTHEIKLNLYKLDNINELARKLEELVSQPFDTFNNLWLKLQKYPDFEKFFGLVYPASDLIHELTHAWRLNSHDKQNVHDSFSIKIGSKLEKRYTFDQAANLVAIEIMANDFTQKLWSKLS